MNPRPDKLIPALYGGIVMALVTTVPFVNFINCFCCAGLLLGGFLAVFFYKSSFTPDTPPFTAGDCAVVGLMAGIVGAVVGSILAVVFAAMFGNILVNFLIKWLHQMNVNLPEETWRAAEDAARGSLTPIRFIFQLFMNVFMYVVFGLLGGLIGYSIYKPRRPTVMPPPPMQQVP